ncbi:hypothetical protein J437_LFUL010102 [Ladona fulva]|uniref:G-protein coupled receptors family 1 profile domain-containing protein n=1 Tax=Ladona fulva TaxID=123851 RepID=A0A8K0KBH5_LADFU|nr:hypothetical protein J437_LFUL010102 [Ladona fulva]
MNFERAYNVLLDLVLLVLPLAILTATYSMITMTLSRGMRLEKAQRNKARKGSRKGSRRSKKWKRRAKGEPGATVRGTVEGEQYLKDISKRNLYYSNTWVSRSKMNVGGVSEVYLERNGSTATRCCRKRTEDEEPRDRWHLRRARYGGATTEDDESDDSEPEEDEGELRRSDAERSLRSKRRVIRMLFVLVLEFFVCWTPLHALNTAASFFGAHAVYSGIGGYPMVAACHLLAYCSSCCNPITYGFMNTRFRQAFLGAFGCQRKKPKGQIDLDRLRSSKSIKVSSRKVDVTSPAFALAYSRGEDPSAIRPLNGVDDCNDSLSEYMPPLLETKCIDETREGLKGVLVDKDR